MDKEFFEPLRDLTYEDLCKEAEILENSELSDESVYKINLLRTQIEFFQLINKLKKLQIETPEFMKQFDLFTFFGSEDYKENEKKIKLLKGRFTKILNQELSC
jgi:hypothetical protein